MTWLSFTNAGEIDPRLITTMGVNVKDDGDGTSPIGYFGTGLKYAIAVLLRNDCDVTILSGYHRYDFFSFPEILRGKSFDFISMVEDGGPSQRLGFTTELGKNWEPWMAYREILCNCWDEQGREEKFDEMPDCEPGITRVLINGRDVWKAHNSRHEWMIEKGARPLFEAPGLVQIFPGTGQAFFYKGIKVGQWQKSAQFKYNILGDLALSEDRQVYSTYEAQRCIAVAIEGHLKDPQLLRQLLVADRETFERDELDFDWSNDASEEFLTTVKELIPTSLGALNRTVLHFYAKRARDEVEVQSVGLTTVEQMMLDKALQFLSGMGYPVSAPITIVESLGDPLIHGLAHTGQARIYIPKDTFGKGTKYLASTLLEEHLHIEKKLWDQSRELQTWLFDKVISLGEELSGEPL